MKAQQQTKT